MKIYYSFTTKASTKAEFEDETELGTKGQTDAYQTNQFHLLHKLGNKL